MKCRIASRQTEQPHQLALRHELAWADLRRQDLAPKPFVRQRTLRHGRLRLRRRDCLLLRCTHGGALLLAIVTGIGHPGTGDTIASDG
jgi:hypothetical protein